MNFIFHGEVVDYDFYFSNKKTTIIFLHGWGGNKFSFVNSMNLFKRKFNILTLTLPTIEPTILSWNMFDYVDLLKNLISSLAIKNYFVVCHSFGFRILTFLSLIHDIKKIVVTGGAGPKKENLFSKIDKNNAKILSKRPKFKKFGNIFSSLDYSSLSSQNKITFKNIVNLNTTKMLKFPGKILLFWGKKDHETRLWIARKIKKQNNAKLFVSRFSHFAYLDDNEMFNHLTMEFFYE